MSRALHLLNADARLPATVIDNRQTDLSTLIHIWMEESLGEIALRGLGGIVLCECQCEWILACSDMFMLSSMRLTTATALLDHL